MYLLNDQKNMLYRDIGPLLSRYSIINRDIRFWPYCPALVSSPAPPPPEMLTCDGQSVQLSVGVVPVLVVLPGHVVPEADGGQRDEAEVQRLQEAPVLLHRHEDGGGDEEEEDGGERRQARRVDGRQPGPGEAPAPVEVGHRPAGHQHHDPLHHGRQEEQGGRDADDGVDHAEGLALVREGHGVAVTLETHTHTHTHKEGC